MPETVLASLYPVEQVPVEPLRSRLGACAAAAAAAEGGALGTNRETVYRSSGGNPVQKRIYRYAARVERYELMTIAGELLKDEYVAQCMRRPAPTGVKLIYSPARKSAHIAGVKRCGLVWMCANCATLISERRRAEVALAIKYVERNGGQIVLATFTLAHGPNTPLQDSQGAFNDAYRRMHQRRDFQVLRVAYGFEREYIIPADVFRPKKVDGVRKLVQTRAKSDRVQLLMPSIKATEVTHGKNGFHPHAHTLYVLKDGVDIEAFQRDLAAAWLPSVRRFGFSASVAHGVDVRATWGDVEKYVSKIGRTWSAADELAKANTKTGRGESFTPADLLRSYRDTGNLAHAALFREYALTMKGTHQLAWSPFFKQLVGIDDRSDAELAADPFDDDKWTVVLAELSLADWRAVRWCGPRAMAELERAGDLGDRDLVAEVVQRCQAKYFAEAWEL